MSRYLMKYNIKARGREGMNNTWSLEDLDTGEVTLTNHIELKVPVKTIEKSIEGKGFGMEVSGEIEHREHPSVGKFVVVNPETDWGEVSDQAREEVLGEV